MLESGMEWSNEHKLSPSTWEHFDIIDFSIIDFLNRLNQSLHSDLLCLLYYVWYPNYSTQANPSNFNAVALILGSFA